MADCIQFGRYSTIYSARRRLGRRRKGKQKGKVVTQACDRCGEFFKIGNDMKEHFRRTHVLNEEEIYIGKANEVYEEYERDEFDKPAKRTGEINMKREFQKYKTRDHHPNNYRCWSLNSGGKDFNTLEKIGCIPTQPISKKQQAKDAKELEMLAKQYKEDMAAANKARAAELIRLEVSGKKI